MGLIVSGSVKKAVLWTPEKASPYFLYLDRDFTGPYGIDKGDRLLGEIISVGETQYNLIGELKGESIDFIFDSPDRIYISQDAYVKLREYGLVREGFWLEVKLVKAVVKGREVEIYTKRDIRA